MPAAAQSRHSTFSDPAVLRAIAELDVLLDGRWLVRQEEDGGVQAVGGIFGLRHPDIGLGNVAAGDVLRSRTGVFQGGATVASSAWMCAGSITSASPSRTSTTRSPRTSDSSVPRWSTARPCPS